MKPCEKFQQIIDRPANRDAEQQRPELSAHLVSCRECKEYAAAAEEAMTLLAPLKGRLPMPPAQVVNQVRQHHRQKRLQALTALSAAGIALLALLWFAYVGAPVATAIVLAWLVLLGWRGWSSVRKARSFELRPGGSTDDLLASWRQELAWRVRTIVVLGPYMALETLLIAGVLIAEGGIGPGVWAVGLVVVGLLGFIGHQLLVRLPALRREQALIVDSVR